MINKKIFIIINFLFIFLFSACSTNLKNLDGIAGDQLFNNTSSSSTHGTEAVKTPTEIDLDNYTFKDLTKEQKRKIDRWLRNNGYNRYGDSAGVIYVGGTPLFDESTGETEDRFEYILRNHPKILKEIF